MLEGIALFAVRFKPPVAALNGDRAPDMAYITGAR